MACVARQGAGNCPCQNSALKDRSFESLSAQYLFLADWDSGVADTSNSRHDPAASGQSVQRRGTPATGFILCSPHFCPKVAAQARQSCLLILRTSIFSNPCQDLSNAATRSCRYSLLRGFRELSFARRLRNTASASPKVMLPLAIAPCSSARWRSTFSKSPSRSLATASLLVLSERRISLLRTRIREK